ncbi:hypothetical protein SLEP1_g49566 [Rubroshorea leprosula]|uniref:Peptidase A1 domain-containing protein n=1 Tax=Rubroshorea leprosula TaxID=152421 RepID=A0AAV5LX71_9ROSI|nr:hypothetical protein SLEP1_g49566 [Rubroshorea leprosula]
MGLITASLASNVPNTISQYLTLQHPPLLLTCHAILSIVPDAALVIHSTNVHYRKRYVEGPPSTGTLATEQKLHLMRHQTKGILTVPNVEFGCGHNNGNFTDHRISGMLGVGYRTISLVRHLGSRFSYCIDTIFDTNYSHKKFLGNIGPKMERDSTPLEVINGRCYVELQGISIGEKWLDIHPSVFRGTSKERSGVVIDSGFPATWLVKEAYKTHREVQNL